MNSSISRRSLLKAAGAGVVAGALARRLVHAPTASADSGAPNVLWIVSEDNSPFLGCYGDGLAHTPCLDAFAAESVKYTSCFSSAPVCAPSRFAIITGVYATSNGPAQHMRANASMPTWMKGFPEQLRAAGYYCTNNGKTDYNARVNLSATWNECSSTAHWRNRPAGAPFFSVFNIFTTHESQMWLASRESGGVQPSEVRVPPYLVDDPVVREDRAHYYNLITKMDARVGTILAQLEADGLADSTIVFYYSDHGGVLPRSKHYCYDSGTRTPLIIRFPSAYRHLAPSSPGTTVEAPVSHVDFGPTVLSLAGVAIPKYVQGIPFAGSAAATARAYAFSSVDRMDERYLMQRSAQTSQWRYIRNYRPHLPLGQFQRYVWKQKGVRVWDRAFRRGGLNAVQSAFWLPAAAEQLYDITSDPDELVNLATEPAHADVLLELRSALDTHMLAVNDNGFIPESASPQGYVASRVAGAYPLPQIMQLAGKAIQQKGEHLPAFETAMKSSDKVLRYWGALGCRMLPEGSASEALPRLMALLRDSAEIVRVAAAEALVVNGGASAGLDGLVTALRTSKYPYLRLQAAGAFYNLGEAARPKLEDLRAASVNDGSSLVRSNTAHTVAVLDGTFKP